MMDWGLDTVKNSGGSFLIGGQNVMQADTKERPQTAQVYPRGKGKKGVAQQRQLEEYEQQKRKAQQIELANKELAAAEHALRTFDSKPVKSKKQLKQEM